MIPLLSVGLGGFLGALARYGLSSWMHRVAPTSFPWGTLAVNLLGCLVMGGLVRFVQVHPEIHPSLRLFLLVGLLGSFTTFSSFGYELFELLENGAWRGALLYAGSSLLVGLLAVTAGWFLVRTASG